MSRENLLDVAVSVLCLAWLAAVIILIAGGVK